MFNKEIFANWAQQYGPPEILDEESQQMNLNEQLQHAYSAGYYRALYEQPVGPPAPPAPTEEPFASAFARANYPQGGYWGADGFFHWNDYTFINGAWAVGSPGGEDPDGPHPDPTRVRGGGGMFGNAGPGKQGGMRIE
jgi:hypothetical protein